MPGFGEPSRPLTSTPHCAGAESALPRRVLFPQVGERAGGSCSPAASSRPGDGAWRGRILTLGAQGCRKSESWIHPKANFPLHGKYCV